MDRGEASTTVELATLEWVDWWNHRRLHQALGYAPPAEHEAHHYREPALRDR